MLLFARGKLAMDSTAQCCSCMLGTCHWAQVVNSPMILADPGMLEKVEGLDELPVMDAPLEPVRTVAENAPTYPRRLGSL